MGSNVYNKSVHNQVCIFNEVLMKIFSNFPPNKLVTFDVKSVTYTKKGCKCNDCLRLQKETILVSQVIA